MKKMPGHEEVQEALKKKRREDQAAKIGAMDPGQLNEYYARSRQYKRHLEEVRKNWLAGHPELQEKDRIYQKELRVASEVKRAAVAGEMGLRTQSHCEELYEKRSRVIEFVNSNARLRAILHAPMNTMSACDTASWVRGSDHLLGKNLYRICVYNNARKEWLELWRTLGGGWTVFTWKKGKWDGTYRNGRENLDDNAAQNRLIKFLGDTTVLQFNHIDLKRINNWLKDFDKPPLKNEWYDFSREVCSTSSAKRVVLFGPNGISPCPNGQLSTISWELFVAGGPSNAPPDMSARASKAGLVPFLNEITPEGKSPSDDALDVQKLFNLYAVIRCVYLE